MWKLFVFHSQIEQWKRRSFYRECPGTLQSWTLHVAKMKRSFTVWPMNIPQRGLKAHELRCASIQSNYITFPSLRLSFCSESLCHVMFCFSCMLPPFVMHRICLNFLSLNESFISEMHQFKHWHHQHFKLTSYSDTGAEYQFNHFAARVQYQQRNSQVHQPSCFWKSVCLHRNSSASGFRKCFIIAFT